MEEAAPAPGGWRRSRYGPLPGGGAGVIGRFLEVRIRTPDGRLIPLLAVAEVEVGLATRRITRRNGERVVTVNATVEPESLGEINRAVKEGFVPELVAMYPGLRVLKGGSQEAEAEFFSEITALYTVALFVIYALIAVAFRSYSLPLLIMTAMPFGLWGLFGHLLFNEPMALFSYFGIGAAAGVVVNDNLVLIDYVRRLRGRPQLARGDRHLCGQPLQADIPDHGDHFCRSDPDYGRAIHQCAVPEARRTLSGLWRVLCAVCQSVAGTRHVFSGSRLAAMAGCKKGPPFNRERCSRGSRPLFDSAHAVHQPLQDR